MNGIRARFRHHHADFTLDVDLHLPAQGVSVLFGPSGSGKTTCLRAMAGLLRARDGLFSLGAEVWQDESRDLFVPPHHRRIGFVFQEASLFPHLSVQGNLDYARKRSGGTRSGGEPVLDLLGIGHLMGRNTQSLSGGERQRVAIARALFTAPRLLLMDEPLASLDLKRKQEILPYLERLRDELSIPIVYVSHAPDEIARLADHVVLLAEGAMVASGPLHETLSRCDLPPIFLDDAGVVVETVLAGHEADDLSRLVFAGGSILVGRRPEAVQSRLRCRVHARDVSLALHKPQASSILNVLPATVAEVTRTDTPGHVLVRLDLGPTPLLARITQRSSRELDLRPGCRVWAQIKAVAVLT